MNRVTQHLRGYKADFAAFPSSLLFSYKVDQSITKFTWKLNLSRECTVEYVDENKNGLLKNWMLSGAFGHCSFSNSIPLHLDNHSLEGLLFNRSRSPCR